MKKRKIILGFKDYAFDKILRETKMEKKIIWIAFAVIFTISLVINFIIPLVFSSKRMEFFEITLSTIAIPVASFLYMKIYHLSSHYVMSKVETYQKKIVAELKVLNFQIKARSQMIELEKTSPKFHELLSLFREERIRLRDTKWDNKIFSFDHFALRSSDTNTEYLKSDIQKRKDLLEEIDYFNQLLEKLEPKSLKIKTT